MYADHGLLYVSDYTRNQMMVLNDELLIATVSSRGEGPGQLLGASSLIVRNDILYIHDEVKKEIIVFSRGKYLRSVKVPSGFDGGTCFGLSGRRFIVTDFQQPHSLAFVNLDTDSVTYFGQIFDFHSPVKNRIRNDRFVFTQGSFIYAVSNNQPVIEWYDLQGNFVDSYDYSNVAEVKNKMLYGATGTRRRTQLLYFGS
jgi:hypothetical protein